MKHFNRQSMLSDQTTDLNQPISPSNLLQSATGPVTVRMTNDYLFRALLQSNNNVLRGLLCSLLQMKESEIESVKIENPVILGEAIDEKDFFLDIVVNLNNHSTITLEMQVINEHNWPERSLSYLCRSFDNLNRGMDYCEVKPAIQIGILDFTLFPEYPEFYATYQFLNVKKFTKYSDKLRLSVLDLTQTKLATKEDIACGLDHWAKLFKATTWEEIKMLAENDKYISDASETIYQLTQDEHIRRVCEAREDFYRRERSVASKLQKNQETIEKQEITITEQATTITEQATTIDNLNAQVSKTSAELEKLKVLLKQHNIPINE